MKALIFERAVPRFCTCACQQFLMISVQNHAFSTILWKRCEEMHFENHKQYSAPAGALTIFSIFWQIAGWGFLDLIRVACLLTSFLACLLACSLASFPPSVLPSFLPFVSCSSRPKWALLNLNCKLLISLGTAPQWALPDLNCKLHISVGTAGHQLRAPDFSGHCRTSAASTFQWAVPDLNRKRQIECQDRCQKES